MNPPRLKTFPVPALALLLALAALPVGPGRALAQDPLDGLEAFVTRVMTDWQAPGVAVAVIKDDAIVFMRGFGVREVGKDAPVDEHTVFAIASTSKAFTVAALGLLVDEERLRWDDRVTEHLIGFQLFDPWVTRELTVRDLLSHRSGLPRGDRLWYGSAFDRSEVLERVRLLEPASSFRSRYGYQNIMYTAAGEIVPAVTDTSWREFIRVRIFEPLGMHASSTSLDALADNGNVATPHGKIGGRVRPISWRDWDNLGGAGAINSCIADMAQWLRFQLAGGVIEGRRLLSEDTIAEMRTPQTIVPLSREEREIFAETHFSAYGLGWRLMDYRGRFIAYHGGALDGMRTHLVLVPEENLGVVALTNINESSVPQAIAWQVVDRYLGAFEKDWNALYLASAERARARSDSSRARIESERLTGTSPTHPLDAFAGRYTSDLYGEITIELVDSALVVDAGPLYVGDLAHWHLNTFEVTWRDTYQGRDFLGFVLDRMGRVAAVDIQGIGRFDRVRERR